MIPITVPNARDTTVSTKWTRKKAVGEPETKDRGSAAMLLRNTGQITQDHTPNTSRNHETALESLTRAV
jgi:hypothetical protein